MLVFCTAKSPGPRQYAKPHHRMSSFNSAALPEDSLVTRCALVVVFKYQASEILQRGRRNIGSGYVKLAIDSLLFTVWNALVTVGKKVTLDKRTSACRAPLTSSKGSDRLASAPLIAVVILFISIIQQLFLVSFQYRRSQKAQAKDRAFKHKGG